MRSTRSRSTSARRASAATRTVETADGPVNLDTGFLVHNATTYPLFTRLLAKLDAGLLYRRMSTPYAFHTPWALPAAQALLREVPTIKQNPLRTSVYSATRGAMCTDDDDLIADVAHDLVREVRFRAALEFLVASGVRTFVDCGPTRLLLDMAADSIPGAVVDGDTIDTWRRGCGKAR